MYNTNNNDDRTWIREDTLTMLLAIPVVLCTIYMENDKNTMVQYNTIQKAVPYMYYVRTVYCKCQTCGLTSADRGHINTSTCITHALPIANAKLVDRQGT